MIGPFVNGAAIIVGSVGGTVFGARISDNMRQKIPIVFGGVAMALGVSMVLKVTLLPAVILALLLGVSLGKLIHLEACIQRGAGALIQMVNKIIGPSESDLSHKEYMEKFTAILILFCTSGTGIFGAMNEGMTGDASLLIIKSFLDLFTSGIFAASLGLPLVILVVPQFLIQAGLFWGATVIIPLTTPTMIADFSAVGGLIMLATGLRLCGIGSFSIATMLPSLIIAMPISALWLRYFSS